MVLRQESFSLQLHQGFGKTTEEKSQITRPGMHRTSQDVLSAGLAISLTNGQPNYTFRLGWLTATMGMRGSQEGSSSPPLFRAWKPQGCSWPGPWHPEEAEGLLCRVSLIISICPVLYIPQLSLSPSTFSILRTQ